MIVRAHTNAAAFALAACALAFLIFAGPSPVAAADGPTVPTASTVVVVLAPYLTWSDLSAEKTPAIWGLMGDAALGNMNARTAEYASPTYAGGTLTLSASRWAKGPVGGPIDAASLDRARSANADSLSTPTFGSLGSAVRAAGRSTVAVGASDTDTSSAAGRLRIAELLATDEDGALDTSLPDILTGDPVAPFGVRTDLDKLASALRIALGQPDRLVVVDVGDLSRAHDATTSPTPYPDRHAAAVRALDAAVGEVRLQLARRAENGSLLMIVPAATDKEWYKAPAFGPLIISGAGFGGEVVSSSTRRPGLATNLDVGPTVLASLGASVPAEMLGKPLHSRSSGVTPAQLLSVLSRDGTSPGVIDQLRDAWVVRWFCYAAIVAVALATFLAFRPAWRGSFVAEGLLVVVMSVMPASWLMFLADRQPLEVRWAATWFGLATVLVALCALAVRRAFWASRVAVPLFLTALSSLVIVADQLTGRPIASGIFSYSVAAGWRFYGMGNEGAAILVAASIAAVGLTVDALAGRPGLAKAARRFGLPVVGLVVVIAAAAPFAGANVGVAVWGVIAFGLAWAAMNGVRLSWRTVGLTLLAVALAVAALAAVDLMRPSGGQSHLARFAGGILSGDVAATTELVQRKLQNNIAYLPQTPYTGLAVAMSAALAALWFAPSRPLRRALEAAPAYGAALLGIVIGSAAAWATEDSGIVMPALMLFAGATPALLLALRSERTKPPQ